MSIAIQNILKVVLAVLLFGCLAHLPYGYYVSVRFAGFVGFSLLGYAAWQDRRSAHAIAYFVLALLFQPFLKVALGRLYWNVVDVLVAIGLIISIMTLQRRRDHPRS